MSTRWALVPDYGEPAPEALSERQRGLLIALDLGRVISSVGSRGSRHLTDDGKVVTAAVKAMVEKGWVGQEEVASGVFRQGRQLVRYVRHPLTPLGAYHLIPSGFEGVRLCPRCGGDYGPLDHEQPEQNGWYCMTCDFSSDEDPWPDARPSWQAVRTWCDANAVPYGVDESRVFEYDHHHRTGKVRYRAPRLRSVTT